VTIEPAPFADFLAAKFALDERSLDPRVQAELVRSLQRLPAPQCLDLGAGTGASVRRMLEWRGPTPWSLTLVERDPGLLAFAQAQALQTLAVLGQAACAQHRAIRSADGRIVLHFEARAVESYRPAIRFDAVVAHAFLDLMPLGPMLARIRRWLSPEGLLYAAINYDGETALDPRHADAGFEAELLDAYNESMEARRIDGERTGGAYCGQRLRALLPQHGFAIVREGRSDWCIVPRSGGYRDRDEACLAVLLELIGSEAAHAGLDPHRLQRWRAERTRLMRAGRLALRVRNRDVLARAVVEA
jgi:SAM-dependent methyltransferase